MSELDAIKRHLDAVAGAQQAMMTALSLCLVAYRGSPQAVAALTTALEAAKANILSSSASDYKIAAFDEVAESLIESLS